MAQLIDIADVISAIEALEARNNCGTYDFIEAKSIAYKQVREAVNSLKVKEIPKWKKTMHDNGCWSCEIGVDPSKRLYEYGRYTIDADELFKLLDKEE